MTGASLAALVTSRRAELGLSLRQVATKSQGLVSPSHIGYLERGHLDRAISDRVLTGLSVALDLPLADLRRAAGLSGRQLPPFEVPERANRLNTRERKLVLNLIDTLLAAHED